MKIGIGINIVYPLSKVVAIATEAERLGYNSFWLHENPVYGDSMMALALIANKTRNIRIGSACISVVTRHPVMIASSSITVQNESNGRFVLGLGLGGFPWLPLIGYPIHPISKTKPLRRITEAVKIIRSLTNNEVADFEGSFYNVKGFRMMTKASKTIPIYIASLGPKILSRTPAIADGAITSTGVLTPKDVRTMINWVKCGEKRYGRRVEKSAYILTSISDSVAEAYRTVKRDPFFIYMLSEVVPEESLREYGINLKNLAKVRDAWKRRDLSTASEYISNNMVEALTASGKREDAWMKVEEYTKTGVDLVILAPIGDTEKALQTFAMR